MTDMTQMINLSAIAYDAAKDIAAAVTTYDSDLSVVWGPAWKSTLFGDPYSLSFITRSASTGAYTLVIRGTNPSSLTAWFGEDLDIDATVPFSTYAPDAPAEAVVSKGTANGLDYLNEATPERGYAGSGTMLEFLQGLDDLGSLTITGHSLGGTLTPALYASLYSSLVTQASSAGPTMGLMSFAGLTPGNAAFNDYLNGIIPTGTAWRVVNPFDIAPLLWTGIDPLQAVYEPTLSMSEVEVDFFTHYFDEAATAYAQPAGGSTVLDGALNPDATSWAAQALYQHHSSTYLALITASS